MSKVLIKQVKVLAGGSAAAQLINILSLPMLSRLYTPGDFGLLAVFTSLIAISAVFGTFKYENAIISADENEEAYEIVWLVILISSIISVCCGLMFIFAHYIVGISGVEDPLFIVASIISGVFFSAIYLALYYYNNKLQNFSIMTKGRIYGALVLAFVSLLYGYLYADYKGLILGTILGLLANIVYLLRCGCWKLRVTTVPSYIRLSELFISRIRFPKYLIPSGFLSSLSSQLHIVIFAKFFDPSASGALGLYNKVVGLPSVIIGASIGDVFRSKASLELKENGECYSLLIKTVQLLFVISLPIALIMLFFSPYLFTFVFGPQWLQAGEFSQILSVNFFLSFIVSPISALIYLGNNQRYDLYSQFLLFFLLVVGMGYSIWIGSLMATLYSFSFAYICKYLLELYFCIRISKGK